MIQEATNNKNSCLYFKYKMVKISILRRIIQMKEVDEFLVSLKRWNRRRKNVKVLTYYEILLNLYYSLGGRLPYSSKGFFASLDGNIKLKESVLYELLYKRLFHLVDEEQIDELVIVNMLIDRMNSLLDEMCFMLLDAQLPGKVYKSYTGYINITQDDVDEVRRSGELWVHIRHKLTKASTEIIECDEKNLYYLRQVNQDYKFLEV